jgi:hypothetical protein
LSHGQNLRPDSPHGLKHVALALGSLRLTPVWMLLLAAASVAVYKFDHSAAPWLAAPLLLASNLWPPWRPMASFDAKCPCWFFTWP